MSRLEFAPIGDRTRKDDFINRAIGVEVTDLHDENVVIGEDETLHFIDPIPMMDETSKIERILAEEASA